MKINWGEDGTLIVHPHNVVIEADDEGFKNLASLLRAFAETPARTVMHVDVLGPTPLSSGGPLLLRKVSTHRGDPLEPIEGLTPGEVDAFLKAIKE